MHQSGIRCAYTSGMETNTTFTITTWTGDTTFRITKVKEHSTEFTAQLGWTHFVEMKRINGRRDYLANLLVVDGEVINMKVVA